MTYEPSLTNSLVGWVALSLIPRIGGRTMSALLDVFGSPRAVFEASSQDLLAVKQIGQKTINAIQDINLDEVEKQVGTWQAQGIQLLTWQDPAYPEPFLIMPDRPPLLFARGTAAQDWRQVVAIVGTREPDRESERLAENMGRELAARGWLVASGLARGIDAAAHRGALLAGRTVAVVGCGVDNLFPVQNRNLAQHILQTGAIYAEVPPDTPPTPGSLMARNRLIAGLAKATIVIQAGLGSGSMEAARRARNQQRQVMTLNHPDYDGNQALIRMEAIPLDYPFSDWDGLANLLHSLPEPPRQLGLFE